MRFILIALALLLYTLSGCRFKHRHVTTGFYFWKTTFSPGINEQDLLQQTNAGRLYIRFFDVEDSYGQTPLPVAPFGAINFSTSVPKGIAVVPVVYITNSALLRLDSMQVITLADKMARKITRMYRAAGLGERPVEYQLDCDWTDKTKDRYFQLVKLFCNQVVPAKVSVTIRLYQYKYMVKCGVPPAHRGMLMYYNMTDFKDVNQPNYILNNTEGKKYITGKHTYPLPLDIALPVYRQGVLFTNNRFNQLMQGNEVDTAIAHHWLVADKDNWYRATADTNAPYNLLNAQSRLRYEQVSPQMLQQAADILADVAANDSCNVVFFHLDAEQYKNFTAHDFKKVADSF